MTFETTIELNTGDKIPQLGYGTALISEDHSQTVDVILSAMEAGYRHFDTASIYYNEKALGDAIVRSGIPRSQLFITTKLWTTDMRAQREEAAFCDSLEKLGLDYVDLYLIHWPVRGRYVASWQVLEALYATGQARNIGVSNFNPHHIDDIIALGGTVPAVNQYQFHPQHACPALRSYCRQRGIVLEACQPLGQGIYTNHPVIQEIGGKYGKSANQVVIRWGLQNGVVTLPKSGNPQRLRENRSVFDFHLSGEDMAVLSHMNLNLSIVQDADPETFTF